MPSLKRVRTLLAMQDPDLRTTLAKGQAPFAVIVTCSDSRLADNLIFDQELGRLFNSWKHPDQKPLMVNIRRRFSALRYLG